MACWAGFLVVISTAAVSSSPITQAGISHPRGFEEASSAALESWGGFIVGNHGFIAFRQGGRQSFTQFCMIMT